MVNILDGKLRAKERLETVTQKTQRLKRMNHLVPKLVIITVGEDPASKVYVGQKQKTARSLGFDFEWVTFEQQASQENVIETIDRLNNDPSVNGILVQLPLPEGFQEKEILDRIDPAKDVDGFHPNNMGQLIANQAKLVPCTPLGIIDLLKANGLEIVGKQVVVVGRSLIVGLPLQLMMIHEDATVTVCHSRTHDLAAVTRRADILVSAVGRPYLIGPEHLKPGAVVIDVGINRLDNGKLIGDVDFERVAPMTSAITPVPGGVGPMTVAMLMYQTLLATCLQNGISYEEL